MKTRGTLAMMALTAAMVASAHAETVEMVLDVTATELDRYALNAGGTIDTVADPSFAPQQFQWVVRFDLDQSTMSSYRTVDERLMTDTFFGNGSTTTTPYSDKMINLMAGEPLVSVGGAQIRASQSTKWLSVSFPMAQPVAVQSSFADGALLWKAIGDGQTTTTTYSRGFNFEGMGVPVANADFVPMDGPAFVEYLRSQIGQTKVNAFGENLDQWVEATDAAGEVVSDNAVLAHHGLRVLGDVSIRSVTTVPEPGTFVLMGMGLAMLAVLGRRESGR